MSDPPATPPDPSDEAADARPGGFTLDLSSGPSKAKPVSWKRKQKQASAVFTKVMDLSSPTSVPEEPAPPLPKPPKEKPRSKKPRTGGATLADLLDAETLARLRGEEEG